jgi:uncharacterized protein (TIGR00730 family)
VRVAIYTGSSTGPTAHVAAAGAFAGHLARSGIGIVYGGGSTGLMGVVADAALAAGGEVIGVLPEHMVAPEVAHYGLTRLEIVTSMHERKARMAELADAFIALPGGAGTLEELFETWTWSNLGLHGKPIALGDIDGFYQPLLAQLEVMRDTGYLGAVYLESLGVVADAEQFLEFVERYQAPVRQRSAGSA